MLQKEAHMTWHETDAKYQAINMSQCRHCKSLKHYLSIFFFQWSSIRLSCVLLFWVHALDSQSTPFF